jgi:hypothetical protein
MKKIPLTQGKFALVDDADFEWLSQWKWHYEGRYAARRNYIGFINGKNKGKKVYMHKELLKPEGGLDVDHINRNKLDNQRENLRVLSRSKNVFNRDKLETNTSGYTGVYWLKLKKRWRASIEVENTKVYLGTFVDKSDAIKKRRDAELRYFSL